MFISLHLRCLPFVCIIGIVHVFSFPCNRFIFSLVKVTRSSFPRVPLHDELK